VGHLKVCNKQLTIGEVAFLLALIGEVVSAWYFDMVKAEFLVPTLKHVKGP
jgi:hypothetical protein